METDTIEKPQARADVLAELLRGQLSHCERTRDLEFKVNLSLWTAIVLAGGALYDSSFWLDSPTKLGVYAGVVFAIWITHAALWLVPIQYSEETDDHFINQYRSEMERLSGCTITKPLFWTDGGFWTKYRERRQGGWTWILGETWITVVLMLLVGAVLMAGAV